jgi:hypothetical protein
MKNDIFDRFLGFLQNLDQQEISYSLAHHRDEAIMVSVALPGERWEVEFLNDGSVEIERFISQGEISGEESLNELFSRYSDPEDVSIKTNFNPNLVSMFLIPNNVQ